MENFIFGAGTVVTEDINPRIQKTILLENSTVLLHTSQIANDTYMP